jgi:hypothetical protein
MPTTLDHCWEMAAFTFHFEDYAILPQELVKSLDYDERREMMIGGCTRASGGEMFIYAYLPYYLCCTITIVRHPP